MLRRLRCGWWELLGLVEEVEVDVVCVVMEDEEVEQEAAVDVELVEAVDV